MNLKKEIKSFEARIAALESKSINYLNNLIIQTQLLFRTNIDGNNKYESRIFLTY